MNNKITIKDVASQAGVGIGTVSRVLNNSPNVKDSTRELVLKVAKELNYIPNGAARMLVKKTKSLATIALLLPVVENQFFFELIKSIHSRLKEERFSIMIFNTELGYESVVHHIVEQQLAGVITLGDPPLTSEERQVLENHRIPFLYVDHHEEQSNYITYNAVLGSQMAAEYLLNKGCKKILLLGLIDRCQQQIDRFKGFRERLKDEDVKVSELCIGSDEESYEVSLSLMNDPELDGVFYFSDVMAYGGIQAKIESKSNITIIGYDDIFPSKFLNLTTIRQSSYTLGREAASTIINLVNQGGSNSFVNRVLTPELIERG